MNIEKIRNYNQKMIAVITTAIVAMAFVGLVFLIIQLFGMIRPGNDTGALLSDQKTDELKKDSLRQQIISFSSPMLVDTSSLIYIIPVNVKTLDKPEEIRKEHFEREFSSGSGYADKMSFFYGSFNNLLVYNYLSGEIKHVCNDRITGADLQYIYSKEDILAVFTGASEDTDYDGQITLTDNISLFIYSLRKGVLRQVKQPFSTIESFSGVQGRKDILITFGNDRNRDNVYDAETEPSFIMKYDYESDSLSPVVSPDDEEQLQRLIDKR